MAKTAAKAKTTNTKTRRDDKFTWKKGDVKIYDSVADARKAASKNKKR